MLPQNLNNGKRPALRVARSMRWFPLTVVAGVQISFRLLTVLAIAAAVVSALPLTDQVVSPSRSQSLGLGYLRRDGCSF